MDKVISTGDATHWLIMALPSVLAVADPVGWRKTKRHRESEGGARDAGILMAPACQVWPRASSAQTRPNQTLHTV